MSTLWKDRFGAAPSSSAREFTASIDLDRRLGAADVRYSRAHVRALRQAGVLDDGEASRLVAALDRVEAEIEGGRLELDVALEDIHTHIERRVTEITGDTGAKLHTGRSRNDQVVTDMRLFVLDTIDAAVDSIRDLQAALLDQARSHRDTLLPAYSHMQRAQPVSLAHHLLAYFWMLERDRDRLAGCRRRASRCPAGSGAATGTGIPLDRRAIAAELGLSDPTENSLDAISDRDFVVELLSAAALCLSHTGRLAADLVLWSTSEFAFVRVPEQFCTGSSMMPQKVNPDTLELVRGKRAVITGELVAMLGLLHALPLGYNRDYQDDKGPLIRGADVLVSTLALLPAIVRGLHFDCDRMAVAAADPGLLATDWAEELVGFGVPFREAYGVIGRLMRTVAESGTDPRELPAQSLADLHPRLPDALAAVPDARSAIARKATLGSTGADALDEQLRGAADALSRGS